jgi:hypothetical protein
MSQWPFYITLSEQTVIKLDRQPPLNVGTNGRLSALEYIHETHYIYMNTLVIQCLTGESLKIKVLICGISQLPWFKYSHHS